MEKQLSKSEKELLSRLIRNDFETTDGIIPEKVKCWELINVAKKMELDKDFIDELEEIYKYEYCTNLIH